MYDTVQVSVVAPEDFINVPAPTVTGASQTWDYSSLMPNYQQFVRFNAKYWVHDCTTAVAALKRAGFSARTSALFGS